MVSSKSSDSVAEPDLGISCVKHMIFPSFIQVARLRCLPGVRVKQELELI